MCCLFENFFSFFLVLILKQCRFVSFILILYNFSFTFFLVECAHLRNNTFLKPSPYVELTIDDRGPRRTEIIKNSSHPKWNETFTLLVTPHSKLNFAVLDHNSFRKDTLIGERKLDLFRLLSNFGGRCENLEITLDLTNESKADTPVKTGELVCVLQEASSELTNCILANSASTNSLPLTPINNGEMTATRAMNNSGSTSRSLPDGVKARVRSQSNENVVATNSTTVSRTSIERSNGNGGVHSSPSSHSVGGTAQSPIANGRFFFKQLF